MNLFFFNSVSRPVVCWAGAALLSATLAGCASHQTAQLNGLPDTSVPAAWSAAPASTRADAAALAGWWQHWGDAPLQTLIEQALQANPDLRQAQAALQQARAQV
ncbi:MAG: hypothetical protein K2Y10_04805, partial [Burkholderiaceae bacterium]|nr:hypothetical protein [Burkholderiaceae bacterium]